MGSNLIHFVLVNQNFIVDEDEYEGGNCRAVVRREKTTHLTAVICYLKPEH